MMKHLGVAAFLALVLTGCEAKDDAPTAASSAQSGTSAAGEKDPCKPPKSVTTAEGEDVWRKACKNNDNKAPLGAHLWNEIQRKAAQAVGAAKDFGQPRVVKRGAKPEIILKDSSLSVDGDLKFGSPIEVWKKKLGGEPRCRGEAPRMSICVWDTLGLEVGTNDGSSPTVEFLVVHLSIPTKDPAEALFKTNADGTPSAPSIEWRPRNPFAGYLELDGFGIDAETKFWEIRSSVNPARNLRCGVLDCSFPHGSFGEHGLLALYLAGRDEYSTVMHFRIDSDTADPQPVAKPKR